MIRAHGRVLVTRLSAPGGGGAAGRSSRRRSTTSGRASSPSAEGEPLPGADRRARRRHLRPRGWPRRRRSASPGSGTRSSGCYDVGIAGLHRLLGNLPAIRRADVVVAVAGMDGALPTVVASLVPAPVVAVPTSVGYGASFGGLAALLDHAERLRAGDRRGEHRQRLRRGRAGEPDRPLDQHRVAVGVEAVALADRLARRRPAPARGRRRRRPASAGSSGEVEVGEQRVHHLEAEAGGDEERRSRRCPARTSPPPAARRALQRAHDGGADGDHASASRRAGAADRRGGLLADLVALARPCGAPRSARR